ncbi:hypothetical protein AB0K00_30590 [Dactylosporangium sp. NPDC049525]|uniref:hypothetical protein n=1 Tax=Dactylosporangium sp. NPDC049525 TaxID=3154730 RepID=UPI0034155228
MVFGGVLNCPEAYAADLITPSSCSVSIGERAAAGACCSLLCGLRRPISAMCAEFFSRMVKTGANVASWSRPSGLIGLCSEERRKVMEFLLQLDTVIWWLRDDGPASELANGLRLVSALIGFALTAALAWRRVRRFVRRRVARRREVTDVANEAAGPASES